MQNHYCITKYITLVRTRKGVQQQHECQQYTNENESEGLGKDLFSWFSFFHLVKL